ncbi:Caspase-3 [Geodia barretti]|uniref:Caspase-3 n=1 Tax=Geodia barretti TaxID=519541 RepID=A0AA35R2H9_GEOBA|nr:Caspase-3 [Geodia barretti]
MPQTHPSAAIFAEYPNVSKDKLTVKDALAVRRALENLTARIIHIGRALSLGSDRLEVIEKAHGASGTRCAIAVIDTWLRGNYNPTKEPYTIAGNNPHPSWWNLVWAVCHRIGGKDPAEARIIAENHKSFHSSAPEPKFSNVHTTPFKKGDEDQVALALEDVWPLWYEIGAGLEIPTSTLDQIQGAPEDQTIGMIKTWIKDGSPPFPCWSQLVEAVAASYGGQNPALAAELAKEHSTGATEGEPEPMESEPSSTTTSTNGTSTTPATGQQVSGGGAMGVDSAHPTPPDSAFSNLQPEIPTASIADDGGQFTINNFIVYRRNKGGKSHGVALVIANERFKGLPQRLCAQVDEQRLLKSLTALGYRVVLRRDQSAEQMEQLIEAVGKNTGSDKSLHVEKGDDSFICVVSSHGDWDMAKNTDVIYGSDRGTMDLQETAYKYLGTTVCDHLKGKPKMFFVQACRGEQYGRIAADDSGAPRLPHESDFFISYSTAPMTKAFRFDPNKAQPEGGGIDLSTEQSYDKYNIGSFYITEICLAFDNLARKMDLMTMILLVHHRLQASDKMLFKLGSKTTRQCPHMSVSLRGAVFFFDKAEELFRDHVKQCLK